MESKLSSLRPLQASRVAAPGRRRDRGKGQRRRSFELTSEGAPPPAREKAPEAEQESEQTLAPPADDEVGARLDITA